MTDEARPPSAGAYPFPSPPQSPYQPHYPGGGAAGSFPGPPRPPTPPRPVPREAWGSPRRVEPVPGTPFGVVHLAVPPITSGLAIGGLVAGIASVLVSLLVGCFGIAGARAGWGAWAAGAFTLLAGIAGTAGIVLGLLGRRQINRTAESSAVRFTGRGVALAGLVCGASGLGLTLLAFLLALLLQAA